MTSSQCPNGHTVREGAAFCPTCGSPVEPQDLSATATASTVSRPPQRHSRKRILLAAVAGIAVAGAATGVAVAASSSSSKPTEAQLHSATKDLCQAFQTWQDIAQKNLTDSYTIGLAIDNANSRAIDLANLLKKRYPDWASKTIRSLPSGDQASISTLAAWGQLYSDDTKVRNGNGTLVLDGTFQNDQQATATACTNDGFPAHLSSVAATPLTPPSTSTTATTVPSAVSFSAIVTGAQNALRAGQVAGAAAIPDAVLTCPNQVPVTPGSVFACTIASQQADPGAVLVVTIIGSSGSTSPLLIPPGSLCTMQLNPAQKSAVAALPGYTGCSTSLPTVTFGSYTGIKPTKIFLSGDSSNIITNITWASWSQAGAVGTGTVNVEGCVPDCASGTQTPTPATVSLTDVVNGQFTKLVEAIQGQSPNTESLPGVGQSAS